MTFKASYSFKINMLTKNKKGRNISKVRELRNTCSYIILTNGDIVSV